MFHDFIQIYFSTIILSIFIFIFVNANPVLSKKSIQRFSLERNCYLYRTGGDEFMILCFRQDRINIQKMILKITAQLQKTPYTCAIGTAFLNKETDFEKACSIADAKMYENKRFLNIP